MRGFFYMYSHYFYRYILPDDAQVLLWLKMGCIIQ